MRVEVSRDCGPLVAVITLECANGRNFRMCEGVAVYMRVETMPALTAGTIVATVAHVARYRHPVGAVFGYGGAKTGIFGWRPEFCGDGGEGMGGDAMVRELAREEETES